MFGGNKKKSDEGSKTDKSPSTTIQAAQKPI